MALTLSNIKRWYLMLTGQSVYHVNQSIGLHFEKEDIKGYYNNMKEKVLKAPMFVTTKDMPSLKLADGGVFYFPVGVFQYAFGLLDLYYETNNSKYIDKFRQCADWALEKQLPSGAWDNFSYYYPNNPYSAMAQGEGASLLIRAFKIYGDQKYLTAAQIALDFMLIEKEKGGCTDYSDDNVILLEYPNRKAVMNGWIFAWWGLYDYVKLTHDKGSYKDQMQKSCLSLCKYLSHFKNSYWSVYDLEGRIASPFYHNLHIAQMQAMFKLTGKEIFNEFAIRWVRQQRNPFFKGFAFVNKAFQKIIER